MSDPLSGPYWTFILTLSGKEGRSFIVPFLGSKNAGVLRAGTAVGAAAGAGGDMASAAGVPPLCAPGTGAVSPGVAAAFGGPLSAGALPASVFLLRFILLYEGSFEPHAEAAAI